MILAAVAILGSFSILFLASIHLQNRQIPEESVQSAAESLRPNPYDVGAFALEVRESLAERCSLQDTSGSAAIDLPPVPDLDVEELNKEAHEQRGYSAAFLDGTLLYGGSVIHKHMAVDDNMYEGIGRMAGEDFTSFADLSSKVDSYEHATGSGLSEGTLNKVGGHVGESMVADHFEKAGVEVEWPAESNQEGWDLLVNGHPVNSKLIKDGSQLSEHFSDHPEIPAIVPGDAENIPDDAVQFDPSEGTGELMEAIASGQEKLVIQDMELSHEEAMEQTDDATDALVGDVLGDSLAGGIPIVTLAVSGWREVKLHGKDDTDWKSSAKNLSFDLAGTGGGGAAGAKGGAAAGAFLGGPVGAALGAALGGVGGAILGRMGSNHFKRKPLRNAAQDLEEAQEELSKTAQREEERCEREFKKAREEREARLEKSARECSSEVQERIERLRQWRVEQAQLSGEDAHEQFGEALSEVQEFRESLQERRSGFWYRFRRRFFPTASVYAVDRAITWAEKTEQVLQQKREEVSSQEVVDRAELDELVGRYGLSRDRVLRGIAKIERERLKGETKLFEQFAQFRERMAMERAEAMEELGDFLIDLRDQMRKTLKPKIEKVRKHEANVLKEADKLGIEL